MAALAAALVTTLPAAVPAAVPVPVSRCVLADRRLTETSGMAWAPDGPRVVADSGNPDTVERLADDCSVASTRTPSVAGRDVEDLARAADGTLWLADVGDNDRARRTVAVIRLDPDGTTTSVALDYPDGPHDAESMILPADGRPVIVTKDLGGRSGVYAPDAPLPGSAPASDPVALRRVGEVVVPPTDSVGGPLGPFGAGLYTGGALSADGRVAALRTYTDAWLYPVAGPTADDVVAGLRAAPVRVPLPGEPQGEAVAFTGDGTLLSAGESPSGGPRATLRSVAGATALVGTVAPSAPAASAAPAPPPVDARGGDLVLPGGLAAVASLGVAVLLVLAVRGRRRAG